MLDKRITKNPKIGALKKTVYNGTDSINIDFFENYNKSSDIVSFHEAISNIVEWSSDLKMLASSFNNFHWTRIIENGEPIMEINDAFFTQLFNAVSGKNHVMQNILMSLQYNTRSGIIYLGYLTHHK